MPRQLGQRHLQRLEELGVEHVLQGVVLRPGALMVDNRSSLIGVALRCRCRSAARRWTSRNSHVLRLDRPANVARPFQAETKRLLGHLAASASEPTSRTA